MSKYALALVNIKGLGVKTYSYLIPDEMQGKIQIGQVILVPFGRQGLVNAFCVGFSRADTRTPSSAVMGFTLSGAGGCR